MSEIDEDLKKYLEARAKLTTMLNDLAEQDAQHPYLTVNVPLENGQELNTVFFGVSNEGKGNPTALVISSTDPDIQALIDISRGQGELYYRYFFILGEEDTRLTRNMIKPGSATDGVVQSIELIEGGVEGSGIPKYNGELNGIGKPDIGNVLNN